MKYKTILNLFALLLLFAGCSKEVEEYNKPAAYWYGKMIEAVSDGNLDKADGYYSSLQSEHIGSPLLPEATLIMAISHLQYEEYLLAEHFLTEYVKRYALPQEREYAEFMKVKAKYMALPNPRRDQGLIEEAITEGEAFKRRYPGSIYYPIVDTMVTRLYMAEASLNESIAELYTRLDKPKGAEFYRNKQPHPGLIAYIQDRKKPVQIERLTPDIVTVEMYHMTLDDGKSEALQDIALDRDIVQIDILKIRGALDLVYLKPLRHISQDIHHDDDPVMDKGRFVDSLQPLVQPPPRRLGHPGKITGIEGQF